MDVNLLVLANSVKTGGRCLAGLNVDTGKWVRPVSNASGDQLEDSLTIIDGHKLQPGDLVRIDVSQAVPQIHHPENYLLSSSIQLIKTNALLDYADLVTTELKRPNSLVIDPVRHIEAKHVQAQGVSDSLGLIFAKQIHFYINEYRKDRVMFKDETHNWDLSNTDDWGQWAGNFPSGIFCISLAEFFERKQAHYKLASGFIPIDRASLDTKNNEIQSSETKNLSAAVSEVLGRQLPLDQDARLHLENWFFQGLVPLKCLYCETQNINVFRAHEVSRRADSETVLHRFAIACIVCNRVYTTPLDNELFRKTLMDAAEKVAKVKANCPICKKTT